MVDSLVGWIVTLDFILEGYSFIVIAWVLMG
jgi:hypothetical protein